MFFFTGNRISMSNTTKIPREDTQRATKRAKMEAERENKERNFGPPQHSGLHLFWVRGPTLRGPSSIFFCPVAFFFLSQHRNLAIDRAAFQSPPMAHSFSSSRTALNDFCRPTSTAPSIVMVKSVESYC